MTRRRRKKPKLGAMKRVERYSVEIESESRELHGWAAIAVRGLRRKLKHGMTSHHLSAQMASILIADHQFDSGVRPSRSPYHHVVIDLPLHMSAEGRRRADRIGLTVSDTIVSLLWGYLRLTGTRGADG